jgi:hypothetical protein
MGKPHIIKAWKLPYSMMSQEVLDGLVKLGFTVLLHPSEEEIEPKSRENVLWSMKDGERYSVYIRGKFFQSFYWAGRTYRYKTDPGYPIYIDAILERGKLETLEFEQPIQVYPYDGEEDIEPKSNNVDHPDHYNKHPSGIEAIDVCQHMSFNLGNAVKYIWRADHKGNGKQDLEKAMWYIKKEIERVYESTDKEN